MSALTFASDIFFSVVVISLASTENEKSMTERVSAIFLMIGIIGSQKPHGTSVK